MAKEELIEMQGTIAEVMPDAHYRVTLENGQEILAYAAGKMRKHRIRIVAGDTVKLEMSPYSFEKGRITYRMAAHPVLQGGVQSAGGSEGS